MSLRSQGSALTILSTLNVQVQSNALAALEALDQGVAEEILSSGCVTGDRINGLCDGETGKWCATILAPVFCHRDKYPFQLPHSCLQLRERHA